MAPVIHLQPAEAYSFYAKNRSRLEEELVEIATNEETNTSVYMTDDGGKPYLYVYRDDKKIFQSECLSAYMTERNLRMIYAKYLSSVHMVDGQTNDIGGNENIMQMREPDVPLPDDTDIDDDSACGELDAMSESEFQDMIDEREDVIYTAVYDLIEILTEDPVHTLDFCDESGGIDEIVDHIVEYLAIQCGLRIRRPMSVVDDETGLHVRTEYPYEEFDFSEEELHG